MRNQTIYKWIMLFAAVIVMIVGLTQGHKKAVSENVQIAVQAQQNQATSGQASNQSQQPIVEPRTVPQTLHFQYNSHSPISFTALLSRQDILIPAKPILQQLHIPYTEYPNTGILELYASGNHLIFKTDTHAVYINGKKEPLIVPAMQKLGQYYLPASFLVYHLKYRAFLNNETRTIIFRKGDHTFNEN